MNKQQCNALCNALYSIQEGLGKVVSVIQQVEYGAEAQPADKGWIAWGGGECPVTPGAKIEIKFSIGTIATIYNPEVLVWKHKLTGYDIIAYRTIEKSDPHAENKRLYALDCEKIKNAWRVWQWRHDGSEDWLSIKAEVSFLYRPDLYRRHPHADLMLEYYRDLDACVNSEWQFKCHEGYWMEETPPAWIENLNYRRKPRTIMIGNMEVPEPLRTKQNSGKQLWAINLMDPDNPLSCLWYQDIFIPMKQFPAFENGLLQETKEGAILQAQAIVKLLTG